MTRAYRVRHRTAYSYDDAVSDSLGVAHLVPRVQPWQQVPAYAVVVDPEPLDLRHDLDFHGNLTTYYQVTRPHTRLVIDAVSDVVVGPAVLAQALLARSWEHARPLRAPRAPGAWRATEFALASAAVEQHPGATAYAASSFPPGRPIGEAVADLTHRIHADFHYDQTATTVTSTVPEVLAARAGVCQDFAHLALACLRSQGLAARYVSGYLSTEPPPGGSRMVGADASHAWVAVWLGESEHGEDQWLAVDPTNDQQVTDRHVTVAWGRDYTDVPPVKGVIFSEATTSTLEVSVDVAPA